MQEEAAEKAKLSVSVVVVALVLQGCCKIGNTMKSGLSIKPQTLEIKIPLTFQSKATPAQLYPSLLRPVAGHQATRPHSGQRKYDPYR